MFKIEITSNRNRVNILQEILIWRAKQIIPLLAFTLLAYNRG